MSKIIIPKGYKPFLGLYETQTAIGLLKRNFEDSLCKELKLKRVSAPLFVPSDSGLNDDLNGKERAVEFDIPETASCAQVVHSLAKWKRMALGKYGFPIGEGLYTDMNAIRRDEEFDNIHSIYVDQWDWELVIDRQSRTIEFLKSVVQRIADSIFDTYSYLKKIFPELKLPLTREVTFVTSQELEDLYPSLTSKQRENEYVKQHKTVFIIGIGGALKSGSSHDGRAPDYDDWSLNGDLLYYCDVLDIALEISSMGIRVDEQALKSQLKISGCENRKTLEFHKTLLQGKFPLTIGGGIGQSRLSMLLLEKAHIGEVQVSVWDKDTISACNKAGIPLL